MGHWTDRLYPGACFHSDPALLKVQVLDVVQEGQADDSLLTEG